MHGSRKRSRGFSLIELMVVVAIIAILARIAVVNYQNSVTKSRRNAAAACLLEEAQYVERYYTTKLTYVGVGTGWPTFQCATDLSSQYQFGVTQDSTKPREYSLTATPKSGSAQAIRDTKCAKLTIDQRGTKSISGTGTVSDCW